MRSRQGITVACKALIGLAGRVFLCDICAVGGNSRSGLIKLFRSLLARVWSIQLPCGLSEPSGLGVGHENPRGKSPIYSSKGLKWGRSHAQEKEATVFYSEYIEYAMKVKDMKIVLS